MVRARPKWKLVEEAILEFIARRDLAEGDKLPSDQEFLEIFTGDARAFRKSSLKGLSKQPIIRAMDELARKGIVIRRAGATTIFRSLTPRLCHLEYSYDDWQYSFGAAARELYGHDLKNKLVEKSLRPPLQEIEGADYERRAHEAFGLARNEPFLVITRVRFLDGRPRAIQRSYLNPSRFSPTFLLDYDFESESLIRLYNQIGYHLVDRDTTLRARFPIERDRALLEIGQVPLLEAEQQIYAVGSGSDEPFVLEYLWAFYVDWDYRVNRRQSRRQVHKLVITRRATVGLYRELLCP